MNRRHFKIEGFDVDVEIESESPQSLRSAILELESKGMKLIPAHEQGPVSRVDRWYYFEKQEKPYEKFISVGYCYAWGLMEAKEEMAKSKANNPKAAHRLVMVRFERWHEGEGSGCTQVVVQKSDSSEMERRVSLWDAINRYAAACGGDPSRRVQGNTARQTAVAEVERIVFKQNTQAQATQPE